MSIDVKQFLQTFVDESNEMLQSMEQDLLDFDLENPDKESLNRIFRVAHSLKSSSNIFGLKNITTLCHSLEAFLSQGRTGEEKLTKAIIKKMFEFIDFMRNTLIKLQQGASIDEARAIELNLIFNKLTEPSLEAKSNIPTKVSIQVEEKKLDNEKKWCIHYTPKENSFIEGHEPYRIFMALTELGAIEVHMLIHKLPNVNNIDPTKCYLEWLIFLPSDLKKDKIEEIFLWTSNIDEVKIELNTIENYEKFIPVSNKIILDDKTPDKQIQVEKNKENRKPVLTKSTIRVSIDKLDDLMNVVGEFVILKSMLMEISKNFDQKNMDVLIEGIEKLEQNSIKLQENLLRIRMIPIEYAFTRFPRLVRDLASQMGKEIDLRITGEKTELDRTIIEKIIDPLSHLLRNSIDHGIEIPAVRKNAGKPLLGTIQINTYQENANVIIDIIDDGAGLNKNKIREKAIKAGLISHSEDVTSEVLLKILSQPGFSTADTISEISGRGVGLDVVFKNIRELGGQILVDSIEGQGTKFQLRLPLTMAIMDSQLIRIGQQIYIIPLISFTEIMELEEKNLIILNGKELYHFRNEYIQVVHIEKLLTPNAFESLKHKYLIIVNDGKNSVGIICEEILWQQQVVIKSLEDNYQKIKGITGATILGDGTTALVLDIVSMIEEARHPTAVFPPPATKPETIPQVFEKYLDILSFIINNEEYGIELTKIREICIGTPITPLPQVPSYVKGIMNLRGKIIPIIDILQRYELGKKNQTSHNQPVITLNIKNLYHEKTAGILVDSVADTYHILSEEIKPLPQKMDSELKENVLGLIDINNKHITLLDTQNLIKFNET